jgi:MoaA/NifB/PqqE/SkfB family radical SAM enzyme
MPTDFAVTRRNYDASRAPGTDVSVLCHAPFVSLNFDQTGRVTACCYNRDYVLGTYPQQTLQDIWTGPAAAALREAFLTGAHAPGCDVCFDQLRGRNFPGVLMRNFDRFSVGQPPAGTGPQGPPLVLEFEISNTCNLECVMCGGHWSSAIRERREKLPPLPNPYDGRFIDQIEALLPSVVFARFLGGEPFLITRYIEIWDRMRRLSPSAEISITTSAATVPDRPRRLLEDLRAHIVVSLDSVDPETYERIRRNARFDQVLANLEDLHDYTRRKGTSLSIACCPMIENWRTLGALVDFCERKAIGLFFNTVRFPLTSSLASLTDDDLTNALETLDAEGRSAGARWRDRNREQWQGLLSQLRNWLDDKRAFYRIVQALRQAASEPARALGPGLAEAGRGRELFRPVCDLARAIDGELARRGAAGMEPHRRDRLRAFLICALVIQAADAWRYEEGPAQAFQEDVGAIRETSDLDLALDALRSFHRLSATDGATTLARRLETACRAAESGASEYATSYMTDAGIRSVQWYLTRASDELFADWIAAFDDR